MTKQVGEGESTPDKANEPDVTPEMVAAGLAAMEEEMGDTFPVASLGNKDVVIAIYRAMSLKRTSTSLNLAAKGPST